MRVGLTGGVASGKSTVSAILAELGAVVIDADLLAREVVAPGTEGLAAVVEEFGPDVLGPDGGLDRPRLGALVFADPERRERWRRSSTRASGRGRPRSRRPRRPTRWSSTTSRSSPRPGRPRASTRSSWSTYPSRFRSTRMVRIRGMTEADARARIAAQADRDAGSPSRRTSWRTPAASTSCGLGSRRSTGRSSPPRPDGRRGRRCRASSRSRRWVLLQHRRADPQVAGPVVADEEDRRRRPRGRGCRSSWSRRPAP